jgi:lipopolysaccharide transport system ATP-binding protein
LNVSSHHLDLTGRMSDDVIVRVENLGKKYRIRHQRRERYTALRDVIAERAGRLFRPRRNNPSETAAVEDFWALQDVSFEIRRGEVLGIIGRNGAGKSTLLKLLSRITEPTAGRIELDGRVASLLEVGTGFHPELSGRENIYLNGAILGMSRVEIQRKFDEIVAFADVEKFLETPVKRYSSGMYVRLAFAVAAHLEPEILIIDEVLAVGDAEFQKKCLGRMSQIAGREGRTVLFVSHNMGAITSLCPTAIWLDHGSLIIRGDTRMVVNDYLLKMPSKNKIVDLTSAARLNIYDERLRIVNLEWLTDLPLKHGETVLARISFTAHCPLSDVSIGIGFSNLEGTRLLSYDTDFQNDVRLNIPLPGDYSIEVKIDELPLAPDMYCLDIGSRSGDFHSLDYMPAATQFEIVAGPMTPGYIARRSAAVRLRANWRWSGR